MSKRPAGVIIWDGPSPFDGQHLTAVLTGLVSKSKNSKTGPMAQLWILPDDYPLDAVANGSDAAACGAYPLRPINGDPDPCYVNKFFIGSVWKATQAGKYPRVSPDQAGEYCKAAHLSVRLGAWGDPAMIPFDVIKALLDASGTGHTGYTHQWAQDWFNPRFLDVCMVSIDDDAQLDAVPDGARTYRITRDGTTQDGEIMCPSSANNVDDNGTRLVQCADCGLCAGAGKDAKNIAISPE